MLAVIKAGGKQYIVHPGDKIKINKLEVSEGEEVVFDDLILVSEDEKDSKIGDPALKGYSVKGKVLKHFKGKKVIVFKYKAKKREHKKQGHRARFTEVEITAIAKAK